MTQEDADSALVNFDDDQADDLDDLLNPDRFRDAVLYGTDWTVRTLLEQIEIGNIDLSPNFQRRDAWSTKNKSRFIESVALQLPIPQIVLAERQDQRGTYIVLDGKQRLLTLAQFAGNLPEDHPLWEQSKKTGPLKISGLKILKDFNGKTYADVKEDADLAKYRIQFDNHTIRSALIRNWPDEDYLYEVFIRLNTGSARLSPQELRQAMKPGPFTEFLNDRSGASQALREILGLSGPDFRMRDVDLLLRLLAFASKLTWYKGNLKPFLDEVHEYFNKNWGAEEGFIYELTDRIEDGLQFLIDAFGDAKRVGRRWADGRFEGPVNRAVLDVQVATAMDPSVRKAVQGGVLNIEDEFIKLSESRNDFSQAVTGTTKSITAIRLRYQAWQSALEQAIGHTVSLPELPNA
ncbi:DUF262 domain-containing protein [Burkholderia seminalis]|uniref:DUF262 domain-containing protein n=1 Tax=Burkholderia seminalis TaxID=488731 RepID=UPI001CF58253|nr:DUF262 domain-containing protein [Burkholderia seminalis]MCA8425840.1 DUF262 domain-containing protein [Burkholderia seminalis]